jgi:hypothetical protein
MQPQPHAERQDYDVALGGLRYPVSKDGILNHARDHGGLDTEVIAMLTQLPEREYNSHQDVTAALRLLYAAREVPPPAAPL